MSDTFFIGNRQSRLAWADARKKYMKRGHMTMLQIAHDDAVFIGVVLAFLDQNFALADMVRHADHALIFHLFNQLGGLVVANRQLSLDV